MHCTQSHSWTAVPRTALLPQLHEHSAPGLYLERPSTIFGLQIAGNLPVVLSLVASAGELCFLRTFTPPDTYQKTPPDTYQKTQKTEAGHEHMFCFVPVPAATFVSTLFLQATSTLSRPFLCFLFQVFLSHHPLACNPSAACLSARGQLHSKHPQARGSGTTVRLHT